MEPSHPSPHMHPLNQTAELLLTKITAKGQIEGDMAVVRLAIAAKSITSEMKLAEKQSLLRWEAEEKWQRLALLTLEKTLTPQSLLMMRPIEAGAAIAHVLGEG